MVTVRNLHARRKRNSPHSNQMKFQNRTDRTDSHAARGLHGGRGCMRVAASTRCMTFARRLTSPSGTCVAGTGDHGSQSKIREGAPPLAFWGATGLSLAGGEGHPLPAPGSRGAAMPASADTRVLWHEVEAQPWVCAHCGERAAACEHPFCPRPACGMHACAGRSYPPCSRGKMCKPLV